VPRGGLALPLPACDKAWGYSADATARVPAATWRTIAPIPRQSLSASPGAARRPHEGAVACKNDGGLKRRRGWTIGRSTATCATRQQRASTMNCHSTSSWSGTPASRRRGSENERSSNPSIGASQECTRGIHIQQGCIPTGHRAKQHGQARDRMSAGVTARAIPEQTSPRRPRAQTTDSADQVWIRR
jgi:hypothetical protein